MIRSLKYIFASGFFIPAVSYSGLAQFHPAAGQPGTSAMYKDSSAFVAWATGCTVVRGWQNVDNTSAGYASAGDSTMGTAMAGVNGTVSLGDGGSATCTFASALRNGPGYDFAVFENAFGDHFLELAFVEVSSDGINFFRFPATSNRQTNVQADSFDTEGEASEYNNLAGKYRVFYGTPFDLEELNGISGLDVNHVTHVKIIDVVGSINSTYASLDQFSNIINDPWPTEFPTGGFDLDAIGVIHNQTTDMTEHGMKDLFSIYPNPCDNILHFSGLSVSPEKISIADLSGKVVLEKNNSHQNSIDISMLESGVYCISVYVNKQYYQQKLVIR